MCGELLVSMYGTRPAAGNWQKFYTRILVDNGFEKMACSTCTFYNPAKDIPVLVHGDDFDSAGEGAEFKVVQRSAPKEL
jgi:hypothetical protein